MKKHKILGLLLISIGFIATLYLSVTNVDMTSMRLLLTYWKEFILIYILILCGLIIVEHK